MDCGGEIRSSVQNHEADERPGDDVRFAHGGKFRRVLNGDFTLDQISQLPEH